jgi:glycosyltransferase involved in cell wall biosynthesis
MRILIATTPQYIAFHGQAIFTLNLAEGLARRGHEVLALVASETGQAYRSERNGVKIVAIRALNLNAFHPDAFLPVFSARAVHQAIEAFQPEIVHIQDHYALCRNATLTARRLGIRIIGTNHFMPDNLAPYVPVLSKIKPAFEWVLWTWMKETYNRADAVAGPSRIAGRILRSVGLRPPVVPISCGINTGLFSPNPEVDRVAWRRRYGIDPEKIVFFFVGRVDKEKHLDVLLRALQRLQRDDIQVVIAGKGARVRQLQSLAAKLDLAGKVVFTGFLPNEDLPSVLNSIDVFAMPSEAELLSIATLQAMACARPILAADAVALPELVDPDVNGRLFPAGNVAAMADAMEWFAGHPERWEAMGQASLDKVQPHSLEAILARYETLYRQLLEDRPITGAV